jgi:Fe-S cluster assembly protein SufD
MKSTLDQYRLELLKAAEVARPDLPAELNSRRLASLSALQDLPLPTARDEEWKYTSLKPLLNPKTNQQETVGSSLADIRAQIGNEPLIHFQDGVLQNPELIDELGFVHALDQHLNGHSEMAADLLDSVDLTDGAFIGKLAYASVQTGLLLDIGNDVQPGSSLHIVYDGGSNTNWQMPVLLIRMAANTQFTVTEHFLAGDPAAVSTSAAVFKLGDGARLTRIKVQDQRMDQFHFANTLAQLAKDSHFENHSLLLGSQIARDNVEVVLLGPGADAKLNGLYLAEGEQVLDTRTFVDHAVPHCESDQHYRAVVSDSARGIFNGKVLVRQDAQKTNAQQLNKNLLLSDSARSDAKPQLEIFADDVKCSHGSTIGQLDETALFYLRSRGIGAVEARHLLTEGFAGEVLQDLPDSPLSDHLKARCLVKLAQLSDEAR